MRRRTLIALALASALVLAACGDDDATVPGDVSIPPAPTAGGGGGDTSGDGGEAPAPGGGSGTATATSPEGTFQLTINDPCLISDFGIGFDASGDGANLAVAGLPGAANIALEVVGGQQWISVAAPIVIEGTTISYDGTAAGTGGDGQISFRAECTELVDVPGS